MRAGLHPRISLRSRGYVCYACFNPVSKHASATPACAGNRLILPEYIAVALPRPYDWFDWHAKLADV